VPKPGQINVPITKPVAAPPLAPIIPAPKPTPLYFIFLLNSCLVMMPFLYFL
jgi:hypothetical protein